MVGFWRIGGSGEGCNGSGVGGGVSGRDGLFFCLFWTGVQSSFACGFLSPSISSVSIKSTSL